ncbi:MAG TPA: regulatory protein RecX [Segetibacter sp.]|jgi:regulatory protein
MFPAKRLTKDEALKKIKYYCSYQERCHQEVTDKLYKFGLFKSEVNEIISDIIENNYLNEERFAIQFAGGKFRIKQWGRKKIQYELQQKKVSPYLIKIALKALDEEEYNKTLLTLAQRKWKELAGEHYLARQSKSISYLLQKGYEMPLITKIIAELKS